MSLCHVNFATYVKALREFRNKKLLKLSPIQVILSFLLHVYLRLYGTIKWHPTLLSLTHICIILGYIIMTTKQNIRSSSSNEILTDKYFVFVKVFKCSCIAKWIWREIQNIIIFQIYGCSKYKILQITQITKIFIKLHRQTQLF